MKNLLLIHDERNIDNLHHEEHHQNNTEEDKETEHHHHCSIVSTTSTFINEIFELKFLTQYFHKESVVLKIWKNNIDTVTNMKRVTLK